jgi:hypothetical protein
MVFWRSFCAEFWNELFCGLLGVLTISRVLRDCSVCDSSVSSRPLFCPFSPSGTPRAELVPQALKRTRRQTSNRAFCEGHQSHLIAASPAVLSGYGLLAFRSSGNVADLISRIAIRLVLGHRRSETARCWVIEDDSMTGLGSSRICNEHPILLSMDEVYVMQHVLAMRVVAAVVTHYSACVVTRTWPSVPFVFVFSVGL